MEHIFHVVQIDHPSHNIINDLELLFLGEFCFFLMQLIVKGSVIHILSDQLILVHSDTHAHVQNDIWVFEIGEDLDFFHEIISAFVGSTGLDVIFHSNGARHIFSSVDLTVTSLTDLLDYLDIFWFDNEIQTLMFFQKLIELPDLLALTLLSGFLSFYHF